MKSPIQAISLYLLAALIASSCATTKPPLHAATTITPLDTTVSQDESPVRIMDEKLKKAPKRKAIKKIERVERHPTLPPFTADQSAMVTIAEYRNVAIDDFAIDLADIKNESHYPADGYVTSNYGWRGTRMHAGIDIKAHHGDNIYAAFDGVVRLAKYYTAFGNCVVIRHYNGIETLYAHATKLLVKPNDVVSAGEVIALAGRTGRATGDHLHFELRVLGQTLDPNLILDTERRKIKDKTLYIAMREGRIFGSNNDSKEEREQEIREITMKKYHTVRSGDILSRIAARYSTTVTAICSMNGIKSTSILHIGQRLRVQ